MEFWYEWFEITVPSICITSPASYYSLSRTYFFTESDMTSVVLWLQRNRAALFWSYPPEMEFAEEESSPSLGKTWKLGLVWRVLNSLLGSWHLPKAQALPPTRLCPSPSLPSIQGGDWYQRGQKTCPAQVIFFPIILFKVLVWKFYRKMNRLRTALSKAKTL